MAINKEQKKQAKPINGEPVQSNNLNWVRVHLLDELVYHNGKQLNPELIGIITGNVVEALRERL